MIHRPIIHVSGPPGGGKTTFIEAVLAANEEDAFIAVRAHRNTSLREPRVTVPNRDADRDPELRRYLDADAMTAVRYEFPSARTEDFYLTDFMHEYSNAILIEGDDPVGVSDLSVHVMAATAGPVLTRRKPTMPSADPASSLMALLDRAGISPDEVLRRLADDARRHDPGAVRPIRARGGRRGPTGAGVHEELRWAVTDEHAGIARAQLVVITVRADDDRARAEELLAQVGQLRSDPLVFADLRLRLASGRTPITAVVADLANRKDPGTRKALTRVRRTLRST